MATNYPWPGYKGEFLGGRGRDRFIGWMRKRVKEQWQREEWGKEVNRLCIDEGMPSEQALIYCWERLSGGEILKRTPSRRRRGRLLPFLGPISRLVN